MRGNKRKEELWMEQNACTQTTLNTGYRLKINTDWDMERSAGVTRDSSHVRGKCCDLKALYYVEGVREQLVIMADKNS